MAKFWADSFWAPKFWAPGFWEGMGSGGTIITRGAANARRRPANDDGEVFRMVKEALDKLEKL